MLSSKTLDNVLGVCFPMDVGIALVRCPSLPPRMIQNEVLPPEGHRSDTARATTTSVASTPARSGPSHQTQSPLPPSSPPNLGSEGLLVNPFIEQVCTTISSYSSFASHCINQSIFPIDPQLLSQSSIQPVSSQIDSPAVSFVYLSIVRMLKPMPRTSQVQFTLIILCRLQPLQVPTITLIE